MVLLPTPLPPLVPDTDQFSFFKSLFNEALLCTYGIELSTKRKLKYRRCDNVTGSEAQTKKKIPPSPRLRMMTKKQKEIHKIKVLSQNFTPPPLR